MEIILSFLAGPFESLSFLSLLDSGCENSGPFLLHKYFKDMILKDHPVFPSVWFHAHV